MFPTDGEIEHDAYLRGLSLLWGAEALRKQRIYLDMNFWARLRRSATSPAQDKAATKLLALLRARVRERRSVCVFSGHTLSELLKHVDPVVHVETAQVVDELGRGFCLASPLRLVQEEVDAWLLSWMQPALAADERLPQQAWTRPAFLWNDHSPAAIVGMTGAQHRSFLDLMWQMPLRAVVEQIHAHPTPLPALDWPGRAADSVNSDIRQFDAENRSRQEMYFSELGGLVASFLELFLQRFLLLAPRHSAPVPQPNEMEACRVILHRAVMADAQHRSVAFTLPSLHISSALHTEIRWDKQRRFEANDFMDIEHAQAALPNCNAFFTDGPHAHLIRTAGLDKTYGCQIFGKIDEGISWLSD